jgi:hypothetical protein
VRAATNTKKVRRGPSPAEIRAKKINAVRKDLRQGKKTLPGLDTEQTKVAAKVLSTGLKAGATRKELLASAETGLVESGMRNLNYGDADSLGWRQERTSQYGVKNATNVKGGAQRFFQESVSDTGGSRGKGQTAGQLAQTIQGSAFPERYDQVKPQAKPIVKAFLKGQAPEKTKKKPGGWAGSKKAALSLIPRNVRAEGRGDKRTPEENSAVGGAANSDHLTTNTKAYAADIPPDAKTYAKLRKELGLPPASTGEDTVTKDGYRYQLIFGSQYGHGDHIHVGATWVGAGVPEGTIAGGYGSGTGGTVTSGGATGTSPGGPTATKRVKRSGKSKRQKGRERLLQEILAEKDEAPARSVPYKVKTQTYDARKAPTKVSLG